MIQETEPKRIIKIYSSLDNKHTIFLAPSLLLARVIVLFAFVSPLSDNRSCKLHVRVL